MGRVSYSNCWRYVITLTKIHIMKKLLYILLAFASSANANDFDTSQHNFKLRSGDIGGEVRQERNSAKDHYQLSYYGVDNLILDYRYVDNPNNVENRIRGTYELYDNGTIFIKPRLEYRHFNEASNYWRLRSIIGVRYNISKDITAWTDTQTSWNFGNGQENNTKIDTNQARIGIDYSVNSNTSLGTFVQYETDKDWNKTGVFFGTSVSIKF